MNATAFWSKLIPGTQTCKAGTTSTFFSMRGPLLATTHDVTVRNPFPADGTFSGTLTGSEGANDEASYSWSLTPAGVLKSPAP
jgi:hypothetical protein